MGTTSILPAAAALLFLAALPMPVAAQQAPASEKQDRVRLTWKTRPSLRIGKQIRVDFKLSLQGDFRRSDQDLAPAGGLFELPRRRGGVKGTAFRILEFEVVRELREGGPWRDVYVNLRPFAAIQLQAGKFKVPFSLDRLTASHELDFLYRSLAAETLAPDRDVGVMLHGQAWRRLVRYQAGLFKGEGENAPDLRPPPLRPNEVLANPSKRSVAGRVRVRPLAALPLPDVVDTFEVGVSAMRSEVPEGLNHLRGTTLFGTRFFGRRYYVNGPRRRASLELSWTPGPAALRAEYLRVEESRLGVGSGDESGPDADLSPLPSRGWYISGSLAVTGESKEGGIVPRRPLFAGGAGAFELAGRYEALRFGTRGTEPASTSPRADSTLRNAERIVTLGVNWYLNRFVKAQVNAIRESLDDESTSPIRGRASFWTIACRVQFAM